jgi:TRAP-type C4-dicarboxylate transport system substrate-binding protein
MCKRSGLPLLFSVLFALLPAGLFAQRGGRAQEVVEVKIASPLPRDSSWGKTLDRIASEWSRVSGGAVRPRVLHNGQEGGEAKMLSSLSSNNIQAALFTSFGLAVICPSVMTLSVPFNIKDDGELKEVLREIEPLLEAQVSGTDYLVVCWSKAGWVNVFSKEPVRTPEDLKRLKIATSTEAVEMNTAFKSMGFQVVETDMNDAGPKLASGAISAIYQNPAAVAAFQLQGELKNMMATPIAPAMGGIVMNRVTWNRISPAHQGEILRVTRRIAEEFDSSMPQTIANAVSVMSRRGLTVNRLNEAQENMWRGEIQRVMPSLLGSTFDREVYQKIGEVLDRYRGGR